MNEAVEKQRRYYSVTATAYEESHVSENDEHMRALAAFSGFVKMLPHDSILDVGAGTGRAVKFLQRSIPGTRVMGIEPVTAMREIGHGRHGISEDSLIDGDALSLQFSDNSFHWCIETGVLHHIENFSRAVEEMVRVADVGVMISDSNNMGQGTVPVRFMKHLIKSLGLWNLFVKVQTRGRGYKENLGDGIYFSFCAFDCVPILKTKFPHIFMINTQPAGPNLYWSAGSVALIAHR